MKFYMNGCYYWINPYHVRFVKPTDDFKGYIVVFKDGTEEVFNNNGDSKNVDLVQELGKLTN